MRVKTPLLTLSIAAALAQPSMAQEGFALEEIIVTAQKRAQSLQDVPVSVNVVSGENITENSIQNLDELSGIVPNLTITEGSQSTNIFIRGLGSGINQGFEQSVGMFIDGIYAGRDRQFRAPFLDVENVEVLRGPQGTLFGKNTIAGALNITTAKPTEEFEARATTTYEPERNEYTLEAVVSGPLSDDLGGRLALRQSEGDGYLDNTYSGREESSHVETVIRGTVVWDATEDLTLTAKLETGRYDVGGESNSLDQTGPWAPLFTDIDPDFDLNDPYSRSTNLVESSYNDNDSFTLTVDWQLGEYTLTAITGYSAYEYSDVQDVDFTPLEMLSQFQDQEFEQWSQEIRLTSPLGESFDFIAGVYWQTSTLEHHKRLASYLGSLQPALPAGPGGVFGGQYGILPSPLGGGLSGAIYTGAATNLRNSRVSDFEQDSDTVAVFAQGNWHISEQLHLTMGLRYTQERKEAERELYLSEYDSEVPFNPAHPLYPTLLTIQGGVFGAFAHEIEDDRTASDLSPSLKLAYDLNDETMIYASVSKAFKSGGFDEAGTSGDDPGEFVGQVAAPFDYEEEEALAFELGAKLRLLDGAATLNLAAFETRYEDLQVSAFIGDKFLVGNAAEATTRGLELDGNWRLTEGLTLSASMAYLDATYDSFENASCTYAQVAAFGGQGCTQDLSGESLAYAPEWSASVNLNHVTSLGETLELRSNLGLAYTDEQYLAQDLDSATLEDSYVLTNARIALSDMSDRWELALVGKNLTDEEVRTFANDVPLMAGAIFAYRLPPRSVAVQFSIRY
jgi:outer membrane receptor protein involved in Fe transport